MKKQRWLCAAAMIMAVLVMMVGCGGAKSMKNDAMMDESYTAQGMSDMAAPEEMGYESFEEMPEDAVADKMDVEESVETTTTAEKVQESKIIRRVNLCIETLYFDEVIEILNRKAEQYGGYVESSDITNGGYYGSGRRYGYFTVRIPAADADAYMESMGDKGVIVSKSENLEDVTLQYVDTKSHIEMLKVERERLMELLEQAQNLEEILMIEERLTGVRYELESYESQMKVLENKVHYTTIMIDVSEVEQITMPKQATLGEKIVDTFKDSLRGIVEFGEGLVILVFGGIPYIVLIAVVITVLMIGIKRKRRKRKEE